MEEQPTYGITTGPSEEPVEEITEVNHGLIQDEQHIPEDTPVDLPAPEVSIPAPMSEEERETKEIERLTREYQGARRWCQQVLELMHGKHLFRASELVNRTRYGHDQVVDILESIKPFGLVTVQFDGKYKYYRLHIDPLESHRMITAQTMRLKADIKQVEYIQMGIQSLFPELIPADQWITRKYAEPAPSEEAEEPKLGILARIRKLFGL